MSIENAIEAIYTSLGNDNEDIDVRIAELKTALKDGNQKEATFDSERLVQGNREGRKRMQSYFKKRGVKVTFKS